MAALAEVLTAFAVLCVAAGLGLRPRRAAQVRELLRRLAGEPVAQQLRGGSTGKRVRRQSVLPAAIRDRVDAAGLEWSDEAVILALGAGLALGYVAGQAMVGVGLLPWVVTATGAGLPFLYWARYAEARRQGMQREAAEAVRALGRAVQSGLPLQQALARFGSRSQGLLATEMARAVDAVEAVGTPLEAALGQVCRRLPFPEVTLVVGLLRTAPQGVHLAEGLRDLAQTLDTRAEALGKARAIVGEPRKEAVAVALAPAVFAVILHLWAPAYFHTLTTGAGQWVLAGGLFGGAAAFLVIRRMTLVHDRF